MCVCACVCECVVAYCVDCFVVVYLIARYTRQSSMSSPLAIRIEIVGPSDPNLK
jgi:hypothetical protein